MVVALEGEHLQNYEKRSKPESPKFLVIMDDNEVMNMTTTASSANT